MNLRFSLLMALSALALAGCGNKGPLVQAPPKTTETPAEQTPKAEQPAPPAEETPAEPAPESETVPPASATPPVPDADGG